MPPTVWQCEGMLRWQYSHRPHLVMAGTSTRSPTLNPLTASPTAVTVPTASWPRMRPSVTAGTSPCRMCRSVPQIVVVSTLTTTSVGSLMLASGTSSHAFWPGPWYMRAFIELTLVIPGPVGCVKIGLGAGVALGQVAQRDRDGRLAARGDYGFARGQVGDERAQRGQPVAVRSGVGADAAGRRAGQDIQEPGRAGIGRRDAENVQRLTAGGARAVGLRVGTGKVAAVVGVPQQRTRTGSGFHRRQAAGRGLRVHHAARPVADRVGETARGRVRPEVADDLVD